jgi:hypothetical protein
MHAQNRLTLGIRPTNVRRMDTQTQLLSEIEDFLSTRKMAETTFGRLAVNDGKFVSRLRAGANMTLATIERARTHIRERRAASEASV